MTALQKLQAKLQATSTETLTGVVFELNLDTSDEAMIVHTQALKVLGERMSVAGFAALCDQLDKELVAKLV